MIQKKPASWQGFTALSNITFHKLWLSTSSDSVFTLTRYHLPYDQVLVSRTISPWIHLLLFICRVWDLPQKLQLYNNTITDHWFGISKLILAGSLSLTLSHAVEKAVRIYLSLHLAEPLTRQACGLDMVRCLFVENDLLIFF